MKKFAHDAIVPDQSSGLSKKQQVATMFDHIAFRYDFLNRFLSLGIDRSWRKKALRKIKDVVQCKEILDVATGTGDFALMADKLLSPDSIHGIDISSKMLQFGQEKICKAGKQGKITLEIGDSENIKYESNRFDAVTVAFGVRNFENLEKGLSEINRVLRPGGILVILEFSRPKGWFSYLYKFYMEILAPSFGALFSQNRKAYEYLNKSAMKFPEGNEFKDIIERNGFKNGTVDSLTMGICSIYTAIK